MSGQDVSRLVRDSISATSTLAPDAITPESHLMRDLGFESIDILNLFVEVEQRLGGRIDMLRILREREDRQSYQSDLRIRDIEEYINKNLSP